LKIVEAWRTLVHSSVLEWADVDDLEVLGVDDHSLLGQLGGALEAQVD